MNNSVPRAFANRLHKLLLRLKPRQIKSQGPSLQIGTSAPLHLIGEPSTLMTMSRQNCQTAYLGDRTILCRVLGKYLMYADAEDVGITPHLCLNGYWEVWITQTIARVLRSGWYCVDVGANHGYYTVIMADAIGPAGRVLALEPNPRTAELLKFTLMVNGFLSRTSIVQMAVSDSDGAYLDLVIPKHLGMNATVCREATASDSVVQVETATLDELTKDWPRVDLVKIDAEGAEEAVWRGMHKTVERNPNIIIVFEINCLRCAKPDQFLHSIQEMGFTLRFIDYDSTIQKVTVDQILAGRGGDDWMLFLQRTA